MYVNAMNIKGAIKKERKGLGLGESLLSVLGIAQSISQLEYQAVKALHFRYNCSLKWAAPSLEKKFQ